MARRYGPLFMNYLRIKNNHFREVTILRGPEVRPAARAGQRLGSWMEKGFYRPMCLVTFITERGHKHTTWVKAKRILGQEDLPPDATFE